MKKLLYIGEKQSAIEALSKLKEVEFDQVRNVVGFHNQLDKLSDYELVLSEFKMKGLCGDEVFMQYKSEFNDRLIPYVLIDRGMDRLLRKRLLKEGVIGDIIYADIQILQPRTNNIIANTEDNWRLNPIISGGGYFHDLAPHQIDLILKWFVRNIG